MNIWRDKEELQIVLNNYSNIFWKKSIKKYKQKYWNIEVNKWVSVVAYYNKVFSNNFITIEDFLLQKPTTKSKKRIHRKKNKINKIKNYKNYIKSKEWRIKRNKYFVRCKFLCELCWNEFNGKNLNLHHHTYKRVWRERNKDLAVVCIKCHENIHFKNWIKIKLNENSLRSRFNELKL